MALSFVASSTAEVGQLNGPTGVGVTKPAGVASGDLMLALLTQNNASGSWSLPAGWTSLVDIGVSQIAYKLAGGAEPASYTFTSPSGGNYQTVLIAAYRGADQTAPVATHGTAVYPSESTFTAPSVSANLGMWIVGLFGMSGGVDRVLGAPSGMTQRARLTALSDANNPTAAQGLIADQPVEATGSTGARTATISPGGSGTGELDAALVAIKPANFAPNAPTLVSPVAGVTVDRTATQRLDWDFSDPDVGDSQSKFDLQYRIGAGAWTTVTNPVPNSYYDVAAGTFAAGNYEWQVRTYDAAGAVGPWSASGFFTAATPPTGPTITDPLSGQTIATQTYTTVWSYPTQQAYQIRTVADSGGVPNTAVVYTDSGTVTSTSARSAAVSFAVNNRTEHVQVRVMDSSLWSPWASVRVNIAYTPPAVPVVTVLASDAEAAISVAVSNPTPGGGEPAVSHNDIWRRETAVGGVGMRVAANRSANGVWLDHTPASGVDYEYAAVAVGTNGSSTTSPWTGGASTTDSLTFYGGY